MYGDNLFGVGGDDSLKGGNDILSGGKSNDILYGDNLQGGNGVNTIFGGNDILEGGEGSDTLNGNEGNDAINAQDGATTDSIDGGLGIDICAIDIDQVNNQSDTRINCEYEDLTSFATFDVDNNVINPGDNVLLTFNLTEISPVKITNLYVQTPSDGNGDDICNYAGILPIKLSSPGDITFNYPADFDNTDVDCNTTVIGGYTAVAETEIGDPITTTFNITFNVLPEAAIGAIGVIGAIFAAMLMYTRRK
ncbi:MAG: hypothetical protein D6752_06980 [Candidatus Nitrosothermus koennekii]|nr:MAG: hypothetical protein D6752_06980 [Candidatus Nitrosothermus koennekii]